MVRIEKAGLSLSIFYSCFFSFLICFHIFSSPKFTHIRIAILFPEFIFFHSFNGLIVTFKAMILGKPMEFRLVFLKMMRLFLVRNP